MCLLGLAVGKSRLFPFVAAFNRDEDTKREASAAATVDDRGLLFGRDAASGGTWLGINLRTGLFTAVLNHDDCKGEAVVAPPSGSGQRLSRGQLVLSVLERGEAEAAASIEDWKRYSGFNLVCADTMSGSDAVVLAASNRPGPDPRAPPELVVHRNSGASSFGFGNGWLSEPASGGAKVLHVRQRLDEVVSGVAVAAGAEADASAAFARAVAESGVADESARATTLSETVVARLLKSVPALSSLVEALERVMSDASGEFSAEHAAASTQPALADYVEGTYEDEAEYLACKQVYVTYPDWSTVSQTIVLTVAGATNGDTEGATPAWLVLVQRPCDPPGATAPSGGEAQSLPWRWVVSRLGPGYSGDARAVGGAGGE